MGPDSAAEDTRRTAVEVLSQSHRRYVYYGSLLSGRLRQRSVECFPLNSQVRLP